MLKNQLSVMASLLLLLGSTSCFDTATTLCATGIRCPADQGCAANQPVCITGLCGNGLIDIGEVCDDGNVISGDDCSADCLSIEICGNGITDAAKGEECDDTGESALCDLDCSIAACGDGTLNLAREEECDTAGETMACDADCTFAFCGDGLLNTRHGESCDHAGESATCNTDCSLSKCGDDILNVTSYEQCDDGGDSSTCDADCTFSSCGDGYENIAAREDCDEGEETSSCDTDCTDVICGDGTVNSKIEQCDTPTDTNLCDSDCTIAECGDGYTNGIRGEICDDAGDSKFCDSDCTRPRCGDRFTNTIFGEECDTDGDSPSCDKDCTTAMCNDKYINSSAGEECDDGDPGDDGNGCNADCRKTHGRICTPGTQVGKLGHLGSPGVPTGLTANIRQFRVEENEARTFTLSKPTGNQFVAISLVTTYNPITDDNYNWAITIEDNSSNYEFLVTPSHANTEGPAFVEGILVVLGFDGIKSKVAQGRSDGYLGNEFTTLAPSEADARTKIVPIEHMRIYDSCFFGGCDRNFSWNIHASTDTACSAGYSSSISGSGQISWYADLLLLAEAIRVDERTFDVNSKILETVSFSIDPQAEQIWLPIVEVYNAQSSEDMSYYINCSLNADKLDCDISIGNGDHPLNGRVAGRIILLESLSGF